MKILHLYSGNLFGGIETMLVTVARAERLVPELEHEFALAFPGRLADELAANGVVVHQLGAVRASRPDTLLAARRVLARVIAGGKFDAAIGHAAWSYAMFAKTARRAGLPLAFWAHDAAGGKHWTERWARRTRPDLVLANSNFTRASVGKLWPSAPRKVIYCPVEDRSERSTKDQRAEIRAELSTPARAVVILQASRMESWKGHEILISALGLLRGNPDWHCWFAGGPQRASEQEYFLALNRQVESLGLAERVHFLGQRTDVPRLMSAADIYCQPNLTPEPFGIVLVEALYAGLPVVTSAMGGAAEIVTESCGSMVIPNNPAELAIALNSLILDPDRRALLARSGPARAVELSDPASRLTRLRTVFAELLKLRTVAHG